MISVGNPNRIVSASVMALGVTSVCAVAAASGAVAARGPTDVIVLGAIGVGVAIAVARPDAAVHILVASFLFQGYLSPPNQFVTAEKAVGILACAAWFLAWASRRWLRMSTAATTPLLLLLVWLVPTGLLAESPGSALVTSARYASFAIVYVIVVQYAQNNATRTEALIRTLVFASGASAAVALYMFASGAVYRVSGPISDPNDTAFILGSCLPFALWQYRYGRGWATRMASAISSILIVLALLGTLSRGALVGVVAATLWAVFARYVRPRFVVIVCALSIVGIVVGYQVLSTQVHDSIARKEHIASNDVQSRLYYWNVAIDEFKGNPILGVGPGQFEVRFFDYAPPFNVDVGPKTTHNTYLNIVAELGLPGLLLFGWFLIAGWMDMGGVRRVSAQTPLLQATRVAFVFAAVAAFFLTEQYYAPLWLIPAVGVAARNSMLDEDAPP